MIDHKKRIGIQDLSVQLGKLPPQAIDLEETVLGAILLERDALNDIVDIIKPESFYKEAHVKIYEAILQLFSESEPVDMLTVTNQCRKNGTLEIIGGAYYISELTQRVNSASNIESHARIISEKFMRREIIKISNQAQNESFMDTNDIFDIIGGVDTQINGLIEQNTKGSFVDFGTSVNDTFKKLYESKDKELTGVASGFTGLDRITGGWQDTDLIIVASRPGMGKTAFSLSIIINAAKEFDFPVGIFSLEMSTDQLNQRVLSHESDIPSDKIKRADLPNHDWNYLHGVKDKVAKYPIYIDDTGSISIIELKAKARRLKRNKGVKLLVVDYIQLMHGDRGGNREQEISSISRGLKGIAKELEIPIIALSQLSRAVETRAGEKKPMLSDLRESGAIEQDADMVIFLYRPEYYNILEDQDGNSLEGKGVVIISKHRHGALGEVYLNFIGQFTRWEDDNQFTKGIGKLIEPQTEPISFSESQNEIKDSPILSGGITE